MGPVELRSKAVLARTLELDRRTADAFAGESLAELRPLYSELERQSDATEALLECGEAACGCDVAASTLLIIVGFAINRLDGEGRWQDWMLDQSLELLDGYRGHIEDCARDAGTGFATSRLSAQHVKALQSHGQA